MALEHQDRAPGVGSSGRGERRSTPRTTSPVTVRKYLALARPAKVRNAVRRRVFEREMAAITVDPYQIVHLGTAYGGWYVPNDLIDDGWMCYCVGAGHDVSFDLALISEYGARVRAFDPFEFYESEALTAAHGDPRFSFHCVAIATQDGPLEMVGRQDEERGNVSAVGHADDKRGSFVLPGRTVTSLMTELGDNPVQLLKLDLEGLEYDVVPSLDLRAIGVQVFLVQLHHNRTARVARRLIDDIRRSGYRLVATKYSSKLTFVSE